MTKCECRGDGSGGCLHTCPGSGPRLCEAQPHQAGCEDTKEKFFSTLSWLVWSLLSLEQHRKWHNQTLNPTCFVFSSDHEKNHPQRNILSDTQYDLRCKSQRRLVYGEQPYFVSMNKDRVHPPTLSLSFTHSLYSHRNYIWFISPFLEVAVALYCSSTVVIRVWFTPSTCTTVAFYSVYDPIFETNLEWSYLLQYFTWTNH